MNDNQPSLAVQAYQRIEEMIVTLELPPGTVFSESDLSKRLDIGRTPVREALQRLASDHLVATLPRRGVVVTEVNMTEHLALIETRRALDRLLAEKAAKRATPEQRKKLATIAADLQEAAQQRDIPLFMRTDRNFDQLVGEAARNNYAAQATAPLHAHCRRFWYMHQHNSDLKQSAELHAQLMRAIENADCESAAQCSDKLMDYLEQSTRSAMDLF